MQISIIIVNFNTKDILENCLNSIYKYTKNIEFEVIIVDNLSIDGSVEMLDAFCLKHKNCYLIQNKKNVGFGQGNNLGIKKAKGDYILLLNSDTLLHENSLVKIHLFMKNHPKCGISSVRLLNSDGSLQSTGGSFPSISRIFFWATFLDDIPFVEYIFGSYHPHSNNYYNSVHQQDWVTGAFFMINKDVLNEINAFDSDFFMYVEELEFCYRVKKNGWEVWYTPETQITHLGGASSSSKTNAILGEFRGLKLFYKKHFPYWKQLVLSVLLVKAAILRIIIFGVIKGDKNRLIAYARALTI